MKIHRKIAFVCVKKSIKRNMKIYMHAFNCLYCFILACVGVSLSQDRGVYCRWGTLEVGGGVNVIVACCHIVEGFVRNNCLHCSKPELLTVTLSMDGIICSQVCLYPQECC